jgi:hypothetical protein
VNLPVQEILTRRDFRTRTSANSRTSQISDFVVSQVHDSGSSRVQDSRSSQVRDSELRRSRASNLRKFAISELHRFKIPDLHKFATPSFAGFLKTHFTNFIKLDVSRVTGFPKFPNTSPSGKRVDSNDPIPRKSQNFSKKRHPRNVGVDTRHPEISQRSNRGGFLKLPPPL